MLNQLWRDSNIESIRGQLLRGGIGSALTKVTATGLGFLLAVMLARVLGPDDYGVYSFVLALTSVLAIPSQLGLPSLMVRETAKAYTRRQWQLLRGLWRWSTIGVWVSSCVIAVLAAVGLWVFGQRIDNEMRVTIIAGFFLVPMVALGNLSGAALRGLGHIILGELPHSVLRPGLLIILIVTTWWMAGMMTPAKAMWLHVAAALAAYLFSVCLLFNVRPNELNKNPPPKFETRNWLLSAVPLAIIGGLQFINNQIDILMLGILSTPAEVGVYKVVVTVSVFVAFGLQAVYTVVGPHIARLHAQNDYLSLQTIITLSTRASFVLALPVAVVFCFSGDILLASIFGEEFAVGYGALLIVTIGQLVNVGVGLVGLILIMTGNEKHSVNALLLGAVSNVVLNATLIPLYGIEGAAIASGAALILWNVYMCIVIKQTLSLKTTVI